MKEEELHNLEYREQEQLYLAQDRNSIHNLEDLIEYCPHCRSYMTAQTLLISRYRCPYCKETIVTGAYCDD